MELPLTPLEFARRARKLYPHREAVVDGDLRLTYAQFFDRCDRWSAALQALGVGKGDRVALIAPNTHAMLASFYAIPQLGAVVVPLNYRLTPDDFAYLIQHSGSRVVCAHSDYLDAIDGIRDQLPGVEHFIALEGARAGWLQLETTLASAARGVQKAGNRGERSDRHQLHERHDVAPQGRDDHASQCVGELGRNAGASPDDAS